MPAFPRPVCKGCSLPTPPLPGDRSAYIIAVVKPKHPFGGRSGKEGVLEGFMY